LPKISGGEAIVAALEANGAKAVFGIPGVHNLSIYDALIDSSLEHYVTRHEQGAGFMADGYARATGKPGVCLPITGPGITNMSTAIAQAFSDSSPLVVISSQIDANLCDQRKGTLHELKDQLALTGQLTEWNARALTPKQCADEVFKAYAWLAVRRGRPVHIEIPLDVLAAKDDVSLPASDAPLYPPLRPDEEEIEKAAALIARSRTPVIYAGGGALASGAGDALLRLSDALGAPIILTCQGKGAVPEDHPAVLGNNLQDPLVQKFLEKCDLTVAIGTHFGAHNTSNWKTRLPGPIIHMDVDRDEFQRNYPAAATVWSDAKLGIEALLQALPGHGTSGLLDEVPRVKAQVCESFAKGNAWEVEYTGIIRNALGRDGILVCDMTALCYPATRCYPVYEPHTFMFPRGLGTLGFALPAAMGARVGRKDRKVVAIAGDGGFMFTCQELAIAAQYNLGVVLVLVNSSSYHVVKRNQIRVFGEKRTIDVDLKNPDFGKMADSFGVWYRRAPNAQDFQRGLDEALKHDGPAMIEIPFGSA